MPCEASGPVRARVPPIRTGGDEAAPAVGGPAGPGPSSAPTRSTTSNLVTRSMRHSFRDRRRPRATEACAAWVEQIRRALGLVNTAAIDIAAISVDLLAHDSGGRRMLEIYSFDLLPY